MTNYLTMDAYKAELERPRQVGLTIDPTTAQTIFDWRDVGDPYGMLGPEHHYGCIGREYFARSPGAEDASRVASGRSAKLTQRDEHKLRLAVVKTERE